MHWKLLRFLLRETWGAKGVFLEITTFRPELKVQGELQHGFAWFAFPIRDIVQSHQQTFALVTKALERRPDSPPVP